MKVGRRDDVRGEDGVQGSAPVPAAGARAADLLHAGSIVTEVTKEQP